MVYINQNFVERFTKNIDALSGLGSHRNQKKWKIDKGCRFNTRGEGNFSTTWGNCEVDSSPEKNLSQLWAFREKNLSYAL